MARNKRKTIKDPEKLKRIRKEARKRWRQKKVQEKNIKAAAAIAGNSAITGIKEDPVVTSLRDVVDQKRGEPAIPPRRPVDVQHHVKEINPSLVVRTEKFLGSGTFGNCYLAYYRDLLVAVKEFKSVKKWTTNDLKKEVRHEARMISYLGDHTGVPIWCENKERAASAYYQVS